MWGDSKYRSLLIRVLGSAHLVGSTNSEYARGTLEAAVAASSSSAEENAPWLAMKELLQIPYVIILQQRPGDVVCFGTGWGHVVVTVGRSIKVACDLVETHDVPVMCQSRHVLASMKKGESSNRRDREPIKEAGPLSQDAALHLIRSTAHLT
jgi:hypothetical protein